MISPKIIDSDFITYIVFDFTFLHQHVTQCRTETILQIEQLSPQLKGFLKSPVLKVHVSYYGFYSLLIIITVTVITSLPIVIWEDGRVVALSHTYAVKSPLVTKARPKFVPKSAVPVDRSPNPTTCLIPGPVRPMMPNGIRIRSAVFPQCTGETDGRMDRPIDRQIVHGKV